MPPNELAQRVFHALTARRWTLSCAESLTGGLVAAAITEVGGSSQVFLGGIVAYKDDIKERLLGVDADVLQTRTAVSAEVAEAMALGCRERFGSTVALATTGYAGPTGENVGLVFIACASPEGVEVREHRFAGDREAVRRQAVDAALRLALESI